MKQRSLQTCETKEHTPVTIETTLGMCLRFSEYACILGWLKNPTKSINTPTTVWPVSTWNTCTPYEVVCSIASWSTMQIAVLLLLTLFYVWWKHHLCHHTQPLLHPDFELEWVVLEWIWEWGRQISSASCCEAMTVSSCWGYAALREGWRKSREQQGESSTESQTCGWR